MKVKKMFWWWIIVGVILIGALQIWVMWAQKRMSFWPDPERQALGGAEALGFSEIEIPTTDGLNLVAWWRAPDDGRAAILFFGGNAGTIADRRIFLELLAGSGYGVLGVNYRGYGGSSGSPSEKGIYIDGLSAYDFLCGQLAIPPTSVIVYGQSMGGTVATQIALKRETAGLVLESSFTSAQAMARRVIPYLPLWYLMTYRFDNLGRIGKITCPKLVVHGQKDETVPYKQGQLLFSRAKEPKRFYTIERAMHNDVLEAGGSDYLDYFREFVDSCLSGDFGVAEDAPGEH